MLRLKQTNGKNENGKTMTDTYNKSSERLWEKLTAHRDELNTNCVDFSEPFPFDQLAEENPFVMDLVSEVQKEFEYGMSEFQCSWAVSMLLRDDMEKYNERHGTNLSPRQYSRVTA